jgi:outer membrane receptor for ferrienterochelin and colicins
LQADSLGSLYYASTSESLNSQGFESQLKLTVGKFTWFFGYTYTDAFLKNGSSESSLILTPQHSIKGDLLFVEENKWRIGWDYEYKSEQILSNNLTSRSLFTTGIIVERTLENFVIFLNAENFTDTRQTRYGSLISGPNETPQFTDVWAPLDGFFFNAGFKIKL